MEKNKTKRFFKNNQIEIARILISELEKWKDATTPTEKEFYRLIDRLCEIIK